MKKNHNGTLKKLLVYLLLFLVVSSCTAIGVVVLYSEPEIDSSIIPSAVDQNSSQAALAKIVSSSLAAENFAGTFLFESDDNKTKLEGQFVVLNNSAGLKVSVDISGKLLGLELKAQVFYVDEWVYVRFGEVFVKVKTDDIFGAFNVVISEIGRSLVPGEFNFDEILAQLENIIISETETGFAFALDLPFINHLVVETNKSYLPTRIEANEIEFGEVKFCLTALASAGSAGIIYGPEGQFDKYIDLSDAFIYLSDIISVYKNLPVLAFGEVNFLDQKFIIEAFVDSSLNMHAVVSYNNLFFEVFLVGSDVYVNLLGTKIKTNFKEFLDFLSKQFGNEFAAAISAIRFSNGDIFIGQGSKVSVERQNGMVSEIVFESFNASGSLGFEKTFPAFVEKPNFSGCLKLDSVIDIFERYTPLLSAKSLSFSLLGNLGATNFDLSGYIDFSKPEALQLFLGKKINDQYAYVWYKDSYAYFMSGGVRAKFSEAVVSSMFDFAKESFGFSLPPLNQLLELLSFDLAKPQLGFSETLFKQLLSLASNEITAINISSKGNISVLLKNGKISISNPQNGVFSIAVSDFVIEGQAVNLSVTTAKNADENKLFMNSLSEFEFVDMSDYGNFAQIAVTTLTAPEARFVGSIDIEVFGIKIKSVDIVLSTRFQNGKLEVSIVFDNLPTLACITKLNAIVWKKQTATLTIKDGKIFIYRTATKRGKNAKVVEQVNRSVSISKFALEDIMDLFGFDETISNRAKKVDFAATGKVFDLGMLSLIDEGLTASLQTSALMQKLSNASIKLTHDNTNLTGVSFSVFFGKHVSISASLKKE